jgi:hypothetical protein
VTKPTRRHPLVRATPPPSRLLKPLLRVSAPLLLPNPPKTETSPEAPRWLALIDLFNMSASSKRHSTMYKLSFFRHFQAFSRGTKQMLQFPRRNTKDFCASSKCAWKTSILRKRLDGFCFWHEHFRTLRVVDDIPQRWFQIWTSKGFEAIVWNRNPTS